MRTFVAIEISEKARKALAKTIDGLRRELGRLAWVKAENLHLTLKFLGEVGANDVMAIDSALSAVAKETTAFGYEIEGLGVFPDSRRARVLWAGLHGGEKALPALAGRVDATLAALGFKREKRPFSAHITIARVRRPVAAERLEAALGRYAGEFFGDEWVEGFVLMESTLARGGSIYTPLARFDF